MCGVKEPATPPAAAAALHLRVQYVLYATYFVFVRTVCWTPQVRTYRATLPTCVQTLFATAGFRSRILEGPGPSDNLTSIPHIVVVEGRADARAVHAGLDATVRWGVDCGGVEV
eukprot:364148-Chlamydomonas_euryale.AAC.5